MLALTPAAIEVVTTLTAASGVPDTGGLRIASTGQAAQASDLQLELVAEPTRDDEIVAATGARVFVEQHAAGFLADKVLDGKLDDEGRARFVVSDQQPNDGMAPV